MWCQAREKANKPSFIKVIRNVKVILYQPTLYGYKLCRDNAKDLVRGTTLVLEWLVYVTAKKITPIQGFVFDIRVRKTNHYKMHLKISKVMSHMEQSYCSVSL